MKISEFEEILKAARESFGDRDIGVAMRREDGATELTEPQLVKWFEKPEGSSNFNIAIG